MRPLTLSLEKSSFGCRVQLDVFCDTKGNLGRIRRCLSFEDLRLRTQCRDKDVSAWAIFPERVQSPRTPVNITSWFPQTHRKCGIAKHLNNQIPSV